MKIEVYDPKLHQSELSEWFKKWVWPANSIELLPSTGLIIPGAAAIFLYYTNSSVCFIEGFISNPELSKEFRDETLNGLVKVAIKQAKENGFKYIIGYTTNPKVAARAEHHGFKVGDSYQCIIKNLEEK